jgi:hypothetical protein
MIQASGNERIPLERGGNITGSCKKTPESMEDLKQYSDRKVFGFFRCFSAGTGPYFLTWV